MPQSVNLMAPRCTHAELVPSAQEDDISSNGVDFEVEGDAQWQSEVSTKRFSLADSAATLKPGIRKVVRQFRGFR